MSLITSLELPALDVPDQGDIRFNLTKLGEGTDLYHQISTDFKNAGLVIHSVEQLKNNHSFSKYNDAKKNMLGRPLQEADFKLNETYLYHGTKADKDRLCEEGFDVNLATDGCFGRGIYFSDTPKKCIKYSKSTILVARVVLGEVKEYEDGKRNATLVREPEKSAPFKGWRFYDSVKGRPRNFTEYVIYRSDRALIEYIITYSKGQDVPEGASPVPDVSKSETEVDGSSECKDTNGKKKKAKTKSPGDADEDSESDSSDDDFKDVDDKNYTSSSSENGDQNYQSLSDSDDENVGNKDPVDVQDVTPIITMNSVIPYFELPAGDLTLDQKKAEFKRVTLEEDDNEVDNMLKKTEEDVERAIYLFFAYKQVRDEEARRLNGEVVDDEPEEDDGSPIFSVMEPEYESDLWNQLSEDEKTAKTNAAIVEFLLITALEEMHKQKAVDLLSNAKYNLDTAVLDYYKAWLY